MAEQSRLKLILVFLAGVIVGLLAAVLPSSRPGSPPASGLSMTSTTQPATSPSPAPQAVYYLGGDISSPGAYSFGGRQITLRQALISARVTSPQGISFITIKRQANGTEELIKFEPGPLLTDGKRDELLMPNDVVHVQK